MTPRSQTPNPVSIPDLSAAVKGRIIDPSDSEYDLARTPFYGGFDRRPAVIVRPTDVQDVIAVINLARQSGLELAVRSGGHSMAAHSLSDGGIVLDLRDMRALQIDPDARAAWAGSGLTAGEYTSAAGARGLATGFGDTGSVGLGGITLGGGVGFLVRKFGLTIDSLLAAEVVTASGDRLLASESSHPGLFWAIRGGGGNFGVVTRFQFALHPLPAVLGGMLFLPAAPEVIAGFIALAEAAPEELSTIANIMNAPPMPFIPPEFHGKLILMAMMVYAGDPAEGQQVVAPFRALAQPIADMLRPMAYSEMYPPEQGEYHPTAVGHNMFVDKIDRADAQTIVRFLASSDAPMRVAQLRVLGGAMARVAPDATAFAHRRARIMVNLASFYTGPADLPARQSWLADFAAALHQSDDGAYVNFMGDEGPTRIRAAYPGSTYARLAEVKALYDPSNLFRLNQNIPPTPSEL